jgi:hypothetical protein
MEEECEQIPERSFSISNWDPNIEKEKLLEFIKSRTIHILIDGFYKEHAELFVKPLFIILDMIAETKYFPEKMRCSKATFIPGPRTIFSLDALTKIVEGVLGIEFTACTGKHYEVHGDPGGFAYRKNRGVSACLGIALTGIELSPMIDNLGAVMVFLRFEKGIQFGIKSDHSQNVTNHV